MSFIILLTFYFLIFLPLSFQHISKHFHINSPIRQISENDCNNNGNKTDEINFYLCNCKASYYGKSCEFNNRQNALNEAMRLVNLISSISSSDSLKEAETQTNILNLVQFKKQLTELNINDIKNQINVIEVFVPQNENEYNVLLCLTGLVITAYLEKNPYDNINKVENIIKNINNKIENIEIGNEGYVIKKIPLQDIYFHKISAKHEIIDKYIKKAFDSLISYIKVLNFIEDDSNYFFISKIPDYSPKTSNLVSINFKYSPNQLLNTNNEKLYIYYSINDFINSFSNEKVVFYKKIAIFYYDIGINIYNITDPAFTYKCYKNGYHYFYHDDLTQKFRKKHIYQNITFTYDNNTNDFKQCPISNVNYTNGYIVLNCSSFIHKQNSLSTKYGLYPQYLDKEMYNKVYELPISCIGELKDMAGNGVIAYYLVFIPWMTILFIITTILNCCCCGKYKNSFYYGEIRLLKDINVPSSPPIKNNNGINNKNNQDTPKKSSLHIEDDIITYNHQNKEESTEISNKLDNHSAIIDVSPPVTKRSFCSYYLDNFLLLHPLMSLSYHSWTAPYYFNYYTYCFSITALLGFIAIYYNEKIIEKRIFNKKNENNFFYAFIHESHICFCSILTMMLLLVGARLFIISYPSTRRSLIEYWEKKQEDKIKEYAKYHRIRVIICLCVMIVLSVIFIIYGIGFDDMYFQTGYGHFSLFILSIIFIWFCFSPIHILIVSFLESRENISRDVIYYIKKLSLF